jgi:hypothetical protein
MDNNVRVEGNSIQVELSAIRLPLPEGYRLAPRVPRVYRERTPEGDQWFHLEEHVFYRHRVGQSKPERLEYYYPRRVTPEQVREICREADWPTPPGLGLTGPARPRWDPDSGTLWYGDTICHRFTRWANNFQIKILEALEARGWPEESIENPLDGVYREDQLRQAIKTFNRETRRFNESLGQPVLFRLVQDHDRVGWAWGPGTKNP